jgi:hypothetical protein
MVRMARALKAWRRRTVGNIKVQLAIIQIVLTMLEKAQANRGLSSDELDFRRRLKIKILGLAGIQISNARQHSRQTWVWFGDANTNFFSLDGQSQKKEKNYQILKLWNPHVN